MAVQTQRGPVDPTCPNDCERIPAATGANCFLAKVRLCHDHKPDRPSMSFFLHFCCENHSEWIRMAWPCRNLGKPRELKRIRSAIGQSSAMDSVPWSFFSDGFRVEKWRVDRCLVYWCLLVVLNVVARFIEIYILFVHTSSHRVVAFLGNSENWIGREYQRGLGGGISWIDFSKMESNGSDTVKECKRGDEAGQAKANCAVGFP